MLHFSSAKTLKATQASLILKVKVSDELCVLRIHSCSSALISLRLISLLFSKNVDVMMRLARIANLCLKKTGFYLHVPSRQADYLMKDEG